MMLVSPLVVGGYMTSIVINIQCTGAMGGSLNLSQAEDSFRALDSDSERVYIHSNYTVIINSESTHWTGCKTTGVIFSSVA